MVSLSQSEDGWLTIKKSLQKGGNGNVIDVVYIFKMILCFNAWINQSSFWSTDNNDKYVLDSNASIKLMMEEIKRLIPSTKKEQGWQNLKVHLLLQFFDMILCFVAPNNYDFQCSKYNNRYFAKNQEEGLKKR